MKRLMLFILILVLLDSAVTVFWADIRTKNLSQYYGKCTSIETDGPLSVDAYVISDVDYPGEGDGFLDKTKSKLETLIAGFGVEHEAYAKFEGKHLMLTTEARMKPMLVFLAILMVITMSSRIGMKK